MLFATVARPACKAGGYDSVNIVSPPLSALYDSLNDEQKARFETTQPALGDFYNSLSDDQKARFNSMGRHLFAQSGGRQSSNE